MGGTNILGFREVVVVVRVVPSAVVSIRIPTIGRRRALRRRLRCWTCPRG